MTSRNRSDPDSCPDPRADQERAPRAPEDAPTTSLTWRDVNYGGVAFLVGSCRARDRRANDDGRCRRR